MATAAQSFNELLISMVRKNRPIWDPKHRDYKDRVTIQMMWQDIGKKLDTHADVARQKWKNLKDYYRNELKKAKRQEERQLEDKYAGARISSWPYYDQMTFLNDTIRFRQQASNEKPLTSVVLVNGSPSNSDSIERTTEDFKIEYDSETEQTEEQFNEKHYQELQPLDHETVGLAPVMNNIEYSFDQSADEIASTSNSRKQTGSFQISELYGDGSEAECKKIKLMFEKEEDCDEDLLFFKSLLPDFKLLPRTSKMALKVKFQQLLYEETLSTIVHTS